MWCFPRPRYLPKLKEESLGATGGEGGKLGPVPCCCFSERDPVSVGFLHTPNFAAFWPQPKQKTDSGNVLVSCKQFLQMSGSCPKPKKNIEKSKDFVQNQKKPREIEKKKQKKQSGQQNVYMIPAHCPRIHPKSKKTSRNRKILSKTKRNLEKSKKTKKTNLANRMFT